jgi:cytochrome bd-type quinol oxidase subunit 2
MSEIDRPDPRSLRLKCNFGVGEAIGNAVLWFLLAIATLGLALLIFPYFFNRSVLNRTEVIDASGRTIGRLDCRFGVGSSVGHFVLWVILIVVTLGLASFVYAYRVLRVVLDETEIVFY